MTQRSTVIFLLDGVEGAVPLRLLAATFGGILGRRDLVDVEAGRLVVFRLLFGGRDDAWIGRNAGEGLVEGRPRDALGLRVRPKFGEEFFERGCIA